MINCYRALTDLYDVLTDIRRKPNLKQILWRNGISILVSRVYEILNAAFESFNVGSPSCQCCKVQKYIHSLANFKGVVERDVILRKNKEARNLDVVNFHDIIHRAVKDSDDQILKVLKSSDVSGNSIMNIQPLRCLGCQGTSFRKPLLHCIRYSCDLWMICSASH